MFAELRRRYPQANIASIDYDPGASEVNQLNRIKLVVATAYKNAEPGSEGLPLADACADASAPLLLPLRPLR
jgi:predicted nucleotide-binding protein (sugar kinase/HSP70/actin superfamily)